MVLVIKMVVMPLPVIRIHKTLYAKIKMDYWKVSTLKKNDMTDVLFDKQGLNRIPCKVIENSGSFYIRLPKPYTDKFNIQAGQLISAQIPFEDYGATEPGPKLPEGDN